jgi:hypothetical protein
MPSPHQVIAALLAEVWPDRIGMASCVASGLADRLNEAGYTIAIMGEPARNSGLPISDRQHDPPKTFRVDRWTPDGSAMEEYVAGVSDYQVAVAAFRAAVERWPKSSVTLRQGTRVLTEAAPTNTEGV